MIVKINKAGHEVSMDEAIGSIIIHLRVAISDLEFLYNKSIGHEEEQENDNPYNISHSISLLNESIESLSEIE